MLPTSGVGVVLRQRAIADHKQLHVLEQPRACPEAVPLVAVDLVKGFANVDTATFEFDVHHRQAIDQDGHVVSVRACGAAVPLTDLVLVDHLQAIVVNILLIDQQDVLRRAIVPLQQLDVILLDAHRLLDDAIVRPGDPLGKELLPLDI